MGAVTRATGIEVDPLVARETEALYSAHGLQVRVEDFTQTLPDDRYNLVLTNPPYVRHHHLGAADKVRLKRAVQEQAGGEVSGLAGLYCFFLLLCDRWLADDALCAWLIPSEFMDVNYGAALRDYLTQQVTLLQIHRFAPEDVQFADALVTSAVVIFRKRRPAGEHQARFSLGGRIATPAQERHVSLQTLRESSKWSVAQDRAKGPVIAGATLGHFFLIRRGVATGANDFFILPQRRAEELGIPASCLRPILPSSRQLQSDVVDAGADGYPLVDEPLALIDCREPEETLAVRHPRFHDYLQRGRADGVAKGYLTSRRRPWYSQEERAPAPFLCSYMGRGNSQKSPFVWCGTDRRRSPPMFG